MKKYDLILFDFDGTLIDSKKDIALATNRTLAHVGLPALPEEVICSYVGSGVRELMDRCLKRVEGGNLDLHLEAAIEFFRTDYIAHCADFTDWYPDVTKTLSQLVDYCPLGVLTNKPRPLTEKILDKLQGRPFFKILGCAEDDFPKKPDPTGPLQMMKQMGVNPSQTLFVGDSDIDAQTAQASGMDLAFVTYGFGKLEHVQDYPRVFTWNSFPEILKIVPGI